MKISFLQMPLNINFPKDPLLAKHTNYHKERIPSSENMFIQSVINLSDKRDVKLPVSKYTSRIDKGLKNVYSYYRL